MSVPATLINIFMRFPINTYLGEKAKSLGEIISTKRKCYFLYRICNNFFRTALFLEKQIDIMVVAGAALCRQKSYKDKL